jgi:hypothetical protein
MLAEEKYIGAMVANREGARPTSPPVKLTTTRYNIHRVTVAPEWLMVYSNKLQNSPI